MLAIECAHQGHDDLANLTATATVSADGSIKVRAWERGRGWGVRCRPWRAHHLATCRPSARHDTP